MLTDNETRYDEAISLLDGSIPIIELWKPEQPSQHHWKGTWLQKARKLIDEALNPPQEPQFEEVEAVLYSLYHKGNYVASSSDRKDIQGHVLANCDDSYILKMEGTCRRPAKPKVKRREEINVLSVNYWRFMRNEDAVKCEVPAHKLKFYTEWDE